MLPRGQKQKNFCQNKAAIPWHSLPVRNWGWNNIKLLDLYFLCSRMDMKAKTNQTTVIQNHFDQQYYTWRNYILLIGWNECILMQQVQITKTAHTFKIWSVLLFPEVISCKLLTSNNIISLEIWCNRHLEIVQIVQSTLDIWAHSIFLVNLHAKSGIYLYKLQTSFFNHNKYVTSN